MKGDDGTEDGETSSVGVDFTYKQLPPRVTSGRVTSVPNTGGPSTTSRVSLDVKGDELSLATPFGEVLEDSSVSTVNWSSEQKVVLPRASRGGLGNICLGLNVRPIIKVGLEPKKGVVWQIHLWD